MRTNGKVGKKSGELSKIREMSGFTLVELIVVVTILAILATIGFLALSGYSQDAKDSAIKANVRSVQTAISSESALTGNSPRNYVIHDPDYALSGAFAYVDWTSSVLLGGDANVAGTNYTAGRPDYVKLKINPDKFRVSRMGEAVRTAFAAYDPTSLMAAGADFMTAGPNGRKRVTSFVQTAGISPSTKIASVAGNFPSTGMPNGYVSGLLRAEPGSSAGLTWALMDGEIAKVKWPATDPYIANVALLLHFNGDSVDVKGKTMTNAGTSAEPTIKKFGSGSRYFPGTTANSLFASASSDFDFWTGDFTVEGWFYKLDVLANKDRAMFSGAFSTWGAGSWWTWGHWSNSDKVFWAFYWAASTVETNITLNEWVHYAWVRSGNTVYQYKNGVMESSGTMPAGTALGSANGLWLGRVADNPTWPGFYGYMDEIRVTKGVARYSWASFPVPTEEFPNQ